MSNLQITLIIIGCIIIAGVMAFNWWQERQFRSHLESSFSTQQNDALLDDPKLDVNDLNLAVPEHFSFEPTQALDFSNKSNQGKTLNIEEQSDEIDSKIDEFAHQYSEDVSDLVQKESAYLANENYDDILNKSHDSDHDVEQPLSKANKISLKHEDIKTIFSDAFNHSFKAESPKMIEQKESNVLIKTDGIAGAPIISSIIVEDHVLSLPEMLHPQIDLTSLLYLSKETPLKTLYDFFIGFIDAYDKSVFIHVLLANNQWKDLNIIAFDPLFSNEKISKVSCSLQLADRAGAVSRNTLNRFQMAVETLSLDMNAHAEWQGTGDALSAAKDLDTFCIDVDKTIGFHLVHGESGAFTGTKFRGLAEAQGLTMSEGTFKFFDKDQPSDGLDVEPSFILFNRDPYPFTTEMLRNSVIKGVTFQLDIPRVKQCDEAYGQMVKVAKQMEVGLNALLVADNNKGLGDIQIEKVRQQLNIIHATMLTRGITPGSDCALRLFS